MRLRGALFGDFWALARGTLSGLFSDSSGVPGPKSSRNSKHLLEAPFLRSLSESWDTAKGGGAKRIVRFLGWGGGETKRTIECALQNQFWRAPKVGFVWSVPVPSKENDIA